MLNIPLILVVVVGVMVNALMVILMVDLAVEIPVISGILRNSADAIGGAGVLVWGAGLLVAALSFWTGFCVNIFNQQRGRNANEIS